MIAKKISENHGIFLEYISMYDKPIKSISENKFEEDTMAKKQKSPEAEAEPTAK